MLRKANDILTKDLCVVFFLHEEMGIAFNSNLWQMHQGGIAAVAIALLFARTSDRHPELGLDRSHS